MSIRNRVALSLPALLLRVALGVTFLWAGLGKLIGTVDVSPEDAAILANMGVMGVLSPAPSSGGTETPPPSTPLPRSGTGGGASTGDGSQGGFAITAASFQTDGQPEAAPDGSAPGIERASGAAGAGGQGGFAAADFPEPRTVGSMYMIAVTIHRAAHPAPRADGTSPMPVWPAPLAGGRWPIYLSYAVMIAELAGGASVLLGLLTRLWSLSLIGVMAGAMWLTLLGPAIQSGDALLGFLPRHEAFSEAWMHPLWQLTLLLTAAALFFAGSGTMALDNLVFGRASSGDNDDE